MRNLFAKLWSDDQGVVAFEYLLVATIVSLGLIAGLGTLQGALNTEFAELSLAILQLDQSYRYSGHSSCLAGTNGVSTTDNGGVNNNTTGFIAVSQASATDISVRVCP